MFTDIQRLDRDIHRELRFRPTGNYRFAARETHAPIFLGEFAAAARCYPLLFWRHPQDGVIASALLGVQPEQNLFVDPADGRWTAAYLPAHIRRYPFILEEGSDGQHFLVIDRASPQFSDDPEAEPLFGPDGEQGPLLDHASELLGWMLREANATKEFCRALDDQKCFAEQQATITPANGAPQLVLNEFLVVDRGRINSLPSATRLDWLERGWIEAIHAHWLSTGNLQQIADLAAARIAATQGPPPGTTLN